MLRKSTFLLILICLIGWGNSYAAEIHDAAKGGDLAAVQSLVSQDKANVNAIDERQRQPLHYAALKGHFDIVKFLVESGADINGADASGDTPLIMAIASNKKPIVEFLIGKGADKTVQQRHFGAVVDYAYYNECRLGWSGITEYFISLGMEFDPDAIDVFGDHRVFRASWFGHSEMLEWLLKFKPDVNVVSERTGRTPLHDVIIRNNPQSASMLIDYGIDIHALDNDGNPAIRYAVQNGLSQTVGELIGSGADMNFTDGHYGRTLLHTAAIEGYLDIAAQLIEGGADVGAKDKAGKTPIYYAARYGNQSLAQLLIDKGAEVGDIDEANYLPSPYMTTPPASGEAVAWYLNHRGWAVRTSDHFLIIDNEQDAQIPATETCLGNGFLNAAEFADQNVYVLYTCYHGEIGQDEYVHKVKDSLSRATYIHNSGDFWRGDKDDDDIVYMDINQSRDFDDFQVYAIAPMSSQMMPLRAYLCKVDGLTLYYCSFNSNDRGAQDEGYAYLKQYADGVDIAFFPMPEPGQEDDSDLKYFMEQFHPKAVCLLDPSRREYLFPAAAEIIRSWDAGVQVFSAENPGDKFEFMR